MKPPTVRSAQQQSLESETQRSCVKCVRADLGSTTNRQEDSWFPDISENLPGNLRAEEVKLGCHDVSYGVSRWN